MSNKPKIYATCPAGCLWETVHKDDFLRSASIVKQTEQAEGYVLEAGRTYKVRKRYDGAYWWGFAFGVTFSYLDMVFNTQTEEFEAKKVTNTIDVEVGERAISEYDDYVKIRLCGFYLKSYGDAADKKIVVVVDLNGNKEEIESGYTTPVLTDNEVTGYGTIQDSPEVFVYNEDATVEAKDGDSVFIRYSSNADGEGFTEEWTEGQNYVGIATGKSAPTDKSGYSWGVFAAKPQTTPLFANDISECTDTSKVYILPDGYIYAYMTKYVVDKTNEYDPNTAQTNYRINSSGVEKSYSGILLLPLVNVTMTDPYNVKITGVALNLGYGAYVQVHYYSGNTWLGVVSYNSAEKFTTFSSNNYELNLYNSNYPNADGVRLQLGIKTEVAITTDDLTNLYVEFVPKTIAETVTDWLSTGHAFVPANYEDRIIAIEEASGNNTKDITIHEERITAIEDGISNIENVAIPSYWKSAVDAAVNKVKNLQDNGGKDVVNFLWFSDMHYYWNADGYVGNIGTLCKAVMDECDIPLTLMNGDTLTAGVLATETDVLNTLKRAMNILAPIGDGLMLVRGNHDDVYGSYSGVSYVNKVAPSKIWNKLHRPQANDFRRVFGGDGTYFYLDNVPQKTRFICLNSHFYEGAGVTSGTTKAMINGFGTAQLNWLGNEALSVSDGWSVIISTHIPPTASPVNGNTTYLSQYSDGADFRKIIAEATANIIGIFCGHCHADAVVTDDLPCPIVTVNCAINSPYDGTSRTANSVKETAIDIVSIDKANRKIYTTRLGAGNDREISY